MSRTCNLDEAAHGDPRLREWAPCQEGHDAGQPTQRSMLGTRESWTKLDVKRPFYCAGATSGTSDWSLRRVKAAVEAAVHELAQEVKGKRRIQQLEQRVTRLEERLREIDRANQDVCSAREVRPEQREAEVLSICQQVAPNAEVAVRRREREEGTIIIVDLHDDEPQEVKANAEKEISRRIYDELGLGTSRHYVIRYL